MSFFLLPSEKFAIFHKHLTLELNWLPNFCFDFQKKKTAVDGFKIYKKTVQWTKWAKKSR
jgi:hypothetical protein